MKYMGSKARIAKYILPIILKDRKEGQWYVEPFVGGANMIDKVDGKRIGADSHYYLIRLLQYVAINGVVELQDKFSEHEYNSIKHDHSLYAPHVVAHCGFNASFGSKWWGGYARARKNGWDRDVVCGKNLLAKQEHSLSGVDFIHCSYDEINVPKGSIIYCDPPYANTTKYKDNFDHELFWQWCRGKAKEGHQVFISEYNAPDDFVCVWEKELGVSVAKDGRHKKATEKLFVHESQLKQ